VGCTGSGKSTLANVLSKSNDFIESNQSTSETKFFQKSQEFEHQDDYYCVIDNIGFGDNTEIDERDVLIRIGEAISSAKEGLSHVLLIFDGHFSDKVKEDFEKLAALKITESLITIVRTRFENFGNSKECEEDKKSLEEESPEIKKVLNDCRKLLYIDNGDPRSRKKSREKVLNHLKSSRPSVFKPKE
jgi:predicted GTPase